MTLAPSGMRMRPSPYGQMPEMARNSVDFPEPEGPASNALSPWGKARLSVATMRVPSGKAMFIGAHGVNAWPGGRLAASHLVDPPTRWPRGELVALGPRPPSRLPRRTNPRPQRADG